MKRIISTLFGLAILCLFAEAHAVPTTVSFTGRLSTNTGPVSGAVTVTFSFFNQATNGTVMWTETRSLTATTTGLVYADLGAMTTLDESVLGNAPLFLEIQVGTEVLTPRLPLQSVPYAIRSHVANEADTLGGTVTANQVVTAATAPIAINTGTASLTTCAANQIYKMVGGNWTCAADVDTNTTYTAAASGGLALAGTAFGLTTCTTGQVLKSTGAGTWGCAADADTNTTYSATANGGLTFNGTQIGLMTCTTGQVLKSTGAGTYGCAADADTTYSATTNGGLTFNGSQVGLMTCTAGQTLKSTGAGTWGCAADNDAGGDITGITTNAGSGLDGGCTGGTCTLTADPTDFNALPASIYDSSASVNTLTTVGTTITSVAITAPSAGTVIAIASADAFCSSCANGTAENTTFYGWLTTNATGALTSPYTSFTLTNPGTYDNYNSFSLVQAFSVTAGVTTIYFRGAVLSVAEPANVNRSKLVLFFVPS